MADLSESEFRTVIDDARARHAAVIALIYHTDTQAAGLLRLFLTLGLAAASAAIAAYKTMPAAAIALAAATISMIVGAGFCVMAMSPAKINLPGRDPVFWLWALRDDVTKAHALKNYLDQMVDKAVMNRDVNTMTSNALTYAKWSVIGSIALALIAGALALRAGL